MLLFAAAVFAGSQACRPCHSGIFDSFARTPMAQSSGRVEYLAPATFTAAGHRYRIEDKRLFFDGGSVLFDFFIGSHWKTSIWEPMSSTVLSSNEKRSK